MPTKQELHFVLESDLEFHAGPEQPVRPIVRTKRTGPVMGTYVKGEKPYSLKFIPKRTNESDEL